MMATERSGDTTPAPTGARTHLLYAGLSSAELVAMVEALTHERLAVLGNGADETWLALIDGHLSEPRRELERRSSTHRDGIGPDPFPPFSRRLADIAARVRREVDIRFPLDLIGWSPARTSAAGECSGPCPICPGGHDRFVVWPATAGRDGRVWCRRCRYTADVIGLHRALEGTSFTDTLGVLAAKAGIVLPRPDQATMRTVVGNARRVEELRTVPGQRVQPIPRPIPRPNREPAQRPRLHAIPVSELLAMREEEL